MGSSTIMQEVFFQAHRGTIDEGKENTLAAFVHAWQFPQAIVETDVRQLADGTLICLHDHTIRRVCSSFTPLLDTPVESLVWEEIKHIDLGKGHHIPLLTSVLDMMASHPRLQLYLEIKKANLSEVLNLLDAYQVTSRILFVHEQQEFLQQLHKLLPANEKMTWCSGSSSQIMEHFELLHQAQFANLTQVQIHYPRQDSDGIPDDFLDYAITCTKAEGVTLQVCPQETTVQVMTHLLSKGIRWFVSNAPQQFMGILEQALRS
jgi:glycerophosphoryl diester phosphodiesterase